MVEWPIDFSEPILNPLCAHPLALMPGRALVFASQCIAKRSPPMPLLSGSTTPSVALAAMAASMADPPRARICAPACDASVWLVEMIPRSEITSERACVRSCAFAAIGNISNDRNLRYRMKPKSYQFVDSPRVRERARKTLLAKNRLATALMLALSSCGPAREAAVDPALDAEIQKIRAIDHHAHPARVVAKGEPPDRGFDALPVDNMEPMSDPLIFRPGNPSVAAASSALFAGQTRQQMMDAKGEQYPAWVLDQMGVDIMFANRVELGSRVQPPRFRWVAFADALLFPLDTAKLGQRNSDRKSFFLLEDALRKKYLEAAGLSGPPATLGEYLSRVVTPTLEHHKQGGALAEKFEAAYLRNLAFDK